MWLNSLECERIVCFINGGTIVTDRVLQDQDWDIKTASGHGVSVKLQRRAAETGNISLELELGSTRTGAKMAGNFAKCTAKYYVIVVPDGEDEFLAYFWEHKVLADLVKSRNWRRAELGQEAHASNAGRTFDLATSVIIPLAAAARVSPYKPMRFNYASISQDPAYQEFLAKNPCGRR